MTTHPIARPQAEARAAAAPADARHTVATVETQTPPRAVDTARALLPSKLQSAAAARRLVRAALREWELGDLVEAGELIVSELAGNAAKTGCQRDMAVTVERITDRCVRISVRDSSRVLPCLIDAGPAAESGRGLALVHHLTGGQWGATAEPFGKTVHADLRARPPASHRHDPRPGAPGRPSTPPGPGRAPSDRRQGARHGH